MRRPNKNHRKIQALIQLGEERERQRLWDLINSQIPQGKLKGNGFDETAQRNGMIIATNLIMNEIVKHKEKS